MFRAQTQDEIAEDILAPIKPTEQSDELSSFSDCGRRSF